MQLLNYTVMESFNRIKCELSYVINWYACILSEVILADLCTVDVDIYARGKFTLIARMSLDHVNFPHA